jgi:Arc/MetJ-type ribon-helix-helix transcriptional regulator
LTCAFLALYSHSMEVIFTSGQEAFVRHAIENGRFRREEDAIQEALSLWEGRERKRAAFLTSLDDAKASIAGGEGRDITQQSMRELSEEIKQRGSARFAEGQLHR